MVAVPGRRYSEHLALGCGAIRRYGAHEPTVCVALLRLLGTCSELIGDNPGRRTAIAHEAALILAAAEREIAEPADLARVRDAARHLVQ